jgi:hypothetical protein
MCGCGPRCAGVYKLCYELKAGDPYHPSASDCTLGKVCTEGNYQVANTEQTMPDMPAWTSNDPICAQKFFNAGGYGLLWVAGVSTDCSVMPDHVVGALPYCPPNCGLSGNQNLPECKACSF